MASKPESDDEYVFWLHIGSVDEVTTLWKVDIANGTVFKPVRYDGKKVSTIR